MFAGYWLPPISSAASTPGPAQAVHAARLKAHALQSHWLASAVDWSRFGGAPPPITATSSSNLLPAASILQPCSHDHPSASSNGAASSSTSAAAAAAPANQPSAARGAAATLDASGSAAAAASTKSDLLVRSQVIGAGLARSQWPAEMMDLRLPKSARLHGRPSNDVDGIAALRGGTLDDPRSSIFHMLLGNPDHIVIGLLDLLGKVGLSRATEIQISGTCQTTGRQLSTVMRVSRQ